MPPRPACIAAASGLKLVVKPPSGVVSMPPNPVVTVNGLNADISAPSRPNLSAPDATVEPIFLRRFVISFNAAPDKTVLNRLPNNLVASNPVFAGVFVVVC